MLLEFKDDIDRRIAEYARSKCSTDEQIELAQWVTSLINHNWRDRFEILTYIEMRMPTLQ